jgi:NAD(P)-dependent dehydrogenase (short-subunit alcohol dehydrogenase family)
MRVKDKVAIVVGGASGIGLASAHRLAEEGAKVVIADMSLEDAQKAADEINKKGYPAIAMKVDMTKPQEADQMAKDTLKKFGQIDILANVAGGSQGRFIREKVRPFAESLKEEWDRIIDINLTGPRNCTRAVVNHMLERKYGKIIFFSTIAALIGGTNTNDYSAAKAGLIGFTRALAVELSPHGINVNCIAPGIVGTARLLAFPPDLQKKMIEGIKFGRMARPEELANVVLFLASDESSYITGETFPVVGGKDLV